MSWLLWLLISPYVSAQNISTSLSIPPLQWINLGRLWADGGSQPPALRDAHITYDPAKRVIVLFGGESSAGNPTQQTYVLQMDSLSWRLPDPPGAQQGIPPSRSAGAFGTDSASNYREGLLVWGGKGGTGDTPLDDLWYYHFQNEFWVEINISSSINPLGRWGAVNGAAPQSSIQNTETFLWIAGGVNDTDAFPLGEVWQLDVTGAIAAGSNAASGSWSEVLNDAESAGIPQKARYGAAGTVVPPVGNTNREGTLVVFGGCDTSAATYNASCGQPDSEILTLPTNPSQTTAQWTIAADCPPGSYAASLAPNRNGAATTFSSQVFLFPGGVDPSVWDDTVSAQDGEIGILVSTSGVWSRVLPAGDPDSQPSMPSPKEGATVYSYDASITGGGSWSDTIVFGGVDVSTGQMTNEMWILRAYNDAIQSSSQHWEGYGDGVLASGVNTTGTGVTVQFLSTCAQRISSSSGTPTSPSRPSNSSSPIPSVYGSNSNLLDHSPVNKYLSTLSVGLILLTVLLHRASSASPAHRVAHLHRPLLYSAILIGVVAYGIGLAGFALGVEHVTSKRSSSSSLSRRTLQSFRDESFALTPHGKVSLALFLALYIVIPLLALTLFLTERPRRWRSRWPTTRPKLQDERKDTDETIAPTAGSRTPGEKDRLPSHSSEDHSALMQTVPAGPEPASIEPMPALDDDEEFPARRSTPPKRNSDPSFFSGAISKFRNRRQSETTQALTAPMISSPPTPAQSRFEVVNRPRKATSTSTLQGGSQLALSTGTHVPRNPSDLSWLERRRSVNLYGQMDYELSHRGAPPPHLLATGPTSDAHEMSPTTQTVPAETPPSLPQRMWRIWFNILLQVVILWSLAFWIVTFAIMGSAAGIAAMAACAVLFYASLVALAIWRLPHRSILAVVAARLRSDPSTGPPSHRQSVATPIPGTPRAPAHSSLGNHHPYMHSAPWRAAHGADEDVFSRTTHGARSLDSDAPDDDEDDDARQARIEEEMARRDVSIFTVPKRRLVIRN